MKHVGDLHPCTMMCWYVQGLVEIIRPVNLSSLFVCPFWPAKRTTGSGQFQLNGPRRVRIFFPAKTLQILTLWLTLAEDLSGSDP